MIDLASAHVTETLAPSCLGVAAVVLVQAGKPAGNVWGVLFYLHIFFYLLQSNYEMNNGITRN